MDGILGGNRQETTLNSLQAAIKNRLSKPSYQASEKSGPEPEVARKTA